MLLDEFGLDRRDVSRGSCHPSSPFAQTRGGDGNVIQVVQGHGVTRCHAQTNWRLLSAPLGVK